MLERPDLRVVLRILEALWRRGEPTRRTRLQQASGTNYTQFVRYLDHLTERGLVTVADGEHGESLVAITPRGVEALRYLAAGLERVLSSREEYRS